MSSTGWTKRTSQSEFPLVPGASNPTPPRPRLEQVDRVFDKNDPANVLATDVISIEATKWRLLQTYGLTEEQGYVHVPIREAMALVGRQPAKYNAPYRQKLSPDMQRIAEGSAAWSTLGSRTPAACRGGNPDGANISICVLAAVECWRGCRGPSGRPVTACRCPASPGRGLSIRSSTAGAARTGFKDETGRTVDWATISPASRSSWCSGYFRCPMLCRPGRQRTGGVPCWT